MATQLLQKSTANPGQSGCRKRCFYLVDNSKQQRKSTDISSPEQKQAKEDHDIYLYLNRLEEARYLREFSEAYSGDPIPEWMEDDYTPPDNRRQEQIDCDYNW